MSSSFMNGMLILAIGSVIALVLILFLNKWGKQQGKKIDQVLNQYASRLVSPLLDSRISIREPMFRKHVVGDLPIHFTPDGLFYLGRSACILLFHRTPSPLFQISNRSYPLDFIATEEGYFWIKGGQGKVSISGTLKHGAEFLALAKEWGWNIHQGNPEGGTPSKIQ